MNHNRIVLKRTNKRDAICFLLFVFLLPYVCACLWGHVGEETSALCSGGGQDVTEQECQIEAVMEWGIWEIPMEEYLAYKLKTVMSGDYEPEALKAQAVLLRTELIQACREQGEERIRIAGEGLEEWYGADRGQEELQRYREAAEATAGLYLCYQGEPIQASYFKVSNGQTRDGGEVWHTEKCPYLVSVPCAQDKASPDYLSEIAVSKAAYLYAVQPRIGEQYDPQELWENVRFAYDDAGYVTNVSFFVGEEEAGSMDGETFRYLFGLPSASFEAKREGAQMIFCVTGVGHGFGMSQYGANSRALNGAAYDEILEEFFLGTELAKFE
ncbi:MAG: SpoIID/LytB domain-containing protein [Muribaculaceae bacterium]|nr:SpoIID/LytB domain-containing protein [Muribaculaceae bacterium]